MENDCKNIKTVFGKKLHSIQTSKQLSQEKLAELANLDRTYISSVELGNRNISIVNTKKSLKSLYGKLKKYYKQSLIMKTNRNKLF